MNSSKQRKTERRGGTVVSNEDLLLAFERAISAIERESASPTTRQVRDKLLRYTSARAAVLARMTPALNDAERLIVRAMAVGLPAAVFIDMFIAGRVPTGSGRRTGLKRGS